MLRICIPVHNEATTIGVLLWRLRTVFQGFSREYDVVVYDDASNDGTDEVLEPYRSVMPLTVVRGTSHRGYAASIDALVRHVAAEDEYARRDAMVLLQGDFTESPEHLPELVKRFEGGADLVAVHRTITDATPADERRLRRWGRWAVSPFLRLPPVADPFTGFRLVRISVLRELLKALGTRPVCAGEGWAANIDFALNVSPFARRIENVEFAPRYDVRQRPSRRRGWNDVIALFHWARGARRSVRPTPGSRPAELPARAPAAETIQLVTPIDRPARPAAPARPAPNARPAVPDRPAAIEEVVAKPAETATTVAADTASVPAASEAASTAKRSRRRRRRSRRGKEAGNEDGNPSVAPADGAADSPYSSDQDSGTSDDDEGEDESGGSESTVVEAGAVDAESGSDPARRKRRSRRRRRGRHPGGPDAASSGNATPPAAEPPAA